VALGVIRNVTAPTYDVAMASQIQKIKELTKMKNMDDLLKSGNTWVV
jgi:hypothetical protein